MAIKKRTIGKVEEKSITDKGKKGKRVLIKKPAKLPIDPKAQLLSNALASFVWKWRNTPTDLPDYKRLEHCLEHLLFPIVPWDDDKASRSEIMKAANELRVELRI